MGKPEDHRQSASLAVGIASSVTTAALTVLAAIAAIVTFVAGRYHRLGLFYGVTALSVGLLVAAVIVGALGIAEITNKGYTGQWSADTKAHLFNLQAKLTFGGFVVLGVALVIGLSAPIQPASAPKDAPSLAQAERVAQQLQAERQKLRDLTGRVHRLEDGLTWRHRALRHR